MQAGGADAAVPRPVQTAALGELAVMPHLLKPSKKRSRAVLARDNHQYRAGANQGPLSAAAGIAAEKRRLLYW